MGFLRNSSIRLWSGAVCLLIRDAQLGLAEVPSGEMTADAIGLIAVNLIYKCLNHGKISVERLDYFQRVK